MSTPSDAISVSSALSLAKKNLEAVSVKVVGEVSEISINPRYKAAYFTLKDQSGSMSCMMWNNRYSASGVQLRVGALVEVAGRFTLYAAKGRMNFDVFSLQLAGEGNLRMQVAELAKRLQTEGLVEASRKRPLPKLPARIGLVTSPSGAAVYDVLRTLRRRYPLAEIVFAGVTVEGAVAPGQIMQGLDAVIGGGAEVVLIVRGGGSYEDLMPFNDEGLARAIASSPVPVVTGIGHEPDTSIADMVSDVRASTPTAAAESVAPSIEQLSQALSSLATRGARPVQSLMESYRLGLSRIASLAPFQEPMRLFADEAQHIDELSSRLASAIPSAIEGDKAHLALVRLALVKSLSALMPQHKLRHAKARESLAFSGRSLMRPYADKLRLESGRLEALSPLAVLSRGYSIAKGADGLVVKSVNDVQPGDDVGVRVADGLIDCKVLDVNLIHIALEDTDD